MLVIISCSFLSRFLALILIFIDILYVSNYHFTCAKIFAIIWALKEILSVGKRCDNLIKKHYGFF